MSTLNRKYIYFELDGINYKREKIQNYRNDEWDDGTWYFLSIDDYWETCEDQDKIEKFYNREKKLKRILK